MGNRRISVHAEHAAAVGRAGGAVRAQRGPVAVLRARRAQEPGVRRRRRRRALQLHAALRGARLALPLAVPLRHLQPHRPPPGRLLGQDHPQLPRRFETSTTESPGSSKSIWWS